MHGQTSESGVKTPEIYFFFFTHVLSFGLDARTIEQVQKKLVSVSLEDLVLAGKESILVPSR